MEKPCKCCESIKFWKGCMDEEYKEKLFAKVCKYTWRKNQRAIKGDQISTITGRAYDLNYCPECGKKVKDIN